MASKKDSTIFGLAEQFLTKRSSGKLAYNSDGDVR
jgi:hypothetical protein